ncbi:hypothetical protein LBMAG27_16760 [Bacteroidota bacterium]|nr:hypothetical protein LBMAG27_16760 [Bacteroidota bacterium]
MIKDWKMNSQKIKKDYGVFQKQNIALLFIYIILMIVFELLNVAFVKAQVDDATNTGTLYVSSGEIFSDEGSFTNSGTGNTTDEGLMYIKGNWTNNGTFLSEAGKVTFWGSAVQNLSGSSNTPFFDATFNNGSGFTLSQTITVAGTLNLTLGNITTSSNEVYVTNDNVSAINPYSENSYIIGYLRRNVIGTGSYYYPLGTSAYYELANVNLASTTGFTNVLGLFTHAIPNPTALPAGLNINGTIITDMLDYGYWTLTPNSSITSGNFTITLNERGQTNGGAAAASYGVLSRINSLLDWQSVGIHDNSTQSVSGGTVTAVRSALSLSSDYGISFPTSGFSLPLELLSFNAELNNNVVDLTWTTASEHNSDYFTIERSYDGIHFTELMKAKAAGNSTNELNYSTVDEHPLLGVSYYRLKQTDFDGSYKYSQIDQVNYLLTNFNFTIIPNPTTIDNLNLNITGAKDSEIIIRLIDAAGKNYFTSNIFPNSNFYNYKINVCQKPAAGFYFVELFINGKIYTRKIVLQ